MENDAKKKQLTWLKYRDDNEACFDSDEESVYCTWSEGYDACFKSAQDELRGYNAMMVHRHELLKEVDMLRKLAKAVGDYLDGDGKLTPVCTAHIEWKEIYEKD